MAFSIAVRFGDLFSFTRVVRWYFRACRDGAEKSCSNFRHKVAVTFTEKLQ